MSNMPATGRSFPPATAGVDTWLVETLADPKLRSALRHDGAKLLSGQLPMTTAESDSLASLPAETARELHTALAHVADHGGTIRLERAKGGGPGTLIVQPAETARGEDFSFTLGIFHCTFDAYFQNWHCGWGPRVTRAHVIAVPGFVKLKVVTPNSRVTILGAMRPTS